MAASPTSSHSTFLQPRLAAECLFSEEFEISGIWDMGYGIRI